MLEKVIVANILWTLHFSNANFNIEYMVLNEQEIADML